MEVIIDFLKENYLFVIYITIMLVELIIILCKRPVKTDTLKERVLSLLPFCIRLTEQTMINTTSKEKLDFCISTCKSLLHLDDSYDSFISSSIESILSTPTKK